MKYVEPPSEGDAVKGRKFRRNAGSEEFEKDVYPARYEFTPPIMKWTLQRPFQSLRPSESCSNSKAADLTGRPTIKRFTESLRKSYTKLFSTKGEQRKQSTAWDPIRNTGRRRQT